MFWYRPLAVLLLCLSLGCLHRMVDAESDNATLMTASVYCQKKKCNYIIGELDWETSTAVATFNDTLLKTGWGILDIASGFNESAEQDNEDIMFAAGFIEGLLTPDHMEYQYTNLYSKFSSKLTPVVLARLKKWFIDQRAWTESMIAHHNGSSALWRHASYILAQLDGLLAGYQNVKSHNGVLDMFALNFLQANGDLLDLLTVLDRKSAVDWRKLSPSEARRYFYSKGHCSALIKLLPGFENIYLSHSTWFYYQGIDRIYKHYNLHVKDPATASLKLSFASYAGFLESLDDFYILGSGMVMLQTTNNIFNESLYNLVTPNNLMAWQRVRMANMMAHSGKEWTQVIAQYNSGTYNNQYMLIDLKKVTLKMPIPDNTLWVAEQIPGLVVAEDVTPILRDGYFPSYNVPFFEEIFNKSGYPDFVAKNGVEFSYQLAPRAKIFRRDVGSVKDMESMKKLMRYNDFHNDPYSHHNPFAAICARGDLDPHSPSTLGCYDTKVTDFSMAKAFQADIISGPTLGTGLPPFSWTGIFKNFSHVGLPETYEFPFIMTQPTLKRN